MSKNKKIMSISEQEKVVGGCGGHGCTPSCPHCGKELPPPHIIMDHMVTDIEGRMGLNQKKVNQN